MSIDRRSLLLGVAGAAFGARAFAQAEGEKSYLAVWATTQKMNLPGLSGLPEGIKLEDLPPEAAAALGGLLGAQKRLEVRLWSHGAAPANAQASLDVPAGLKLGKTLPLQIQRPAERKAEAEKIRQQIGKTQIPDFEIRQYWGCSETVLPGQPKVWKLSGLQGAERERFERFQQQGSFLERPDWTEAVWPNSMGGGGVPGAPGGRPGFPGGAPGMAQPGSLVGEHTLRTTYAGEAKFRVDAPVDFLAPIEFTSPAPNGRPDLKQAVRLAWKPVPAAIGYQLWAVAPRGEKLLIMWAGGRNAEGMTAATEFPQMAEVRQMVEKGLALAPDVTSCTIPAGIFEGTQATMVQMVAYGPGQAFEPAGAPAIRVQTRSMSMLSLGGPGFGGPGR